MKIETKTFFKCDYCGKKSFYKKSMEKHEQFCMKNPENSPACFGCVHLGTNTEIEEVHYEGGGEIHTRDVKHFFPFYCKKFEQAMHNKKFQILHLEYCEKLGTELMPKICNDKQCEEREELIDLF